MEAELDSVAVGFLLSLRVDGALHVLEAAVLLRYQGRHVGRTMFNELEREAGISGFEEITLTTFRNVLWNAPFYFRLGVEEIELNKSRPELPKSFAEELQRGCAKQADIAMRKRIVKDDYHDVDSRQSSKIAAEEPTPRARDERGRISSHG